MNDAGVTRVAVYIDFDNIVISRYEQVHGRGQFQRDKVREFSQADRPADHDVTERVRRATVDVGAVRADPVLGPLAAAHLGPVIPGAWNPFESAHGSVWKLVAANKVSSGAKTAPLAKK